MSSQKNGTNCTHTLAKLCVCVWGGGGGERKRGGGKCGSRKERM